LHRPARLNNFRWGCWNGAIREQSRGASFKSATAN
jgi:hypothetical protein